MICLSPGWPLLSNPNITLTNKDKQGIFDTIVSLSTRLREAGVTLYAVDTLGPTENPSREFYYEAFLKGVRSPRDAQFGNLSLEVLAAQSGGRVLNAGNDVADKIQTCVRDAAAYYVLTFAAPAADSPNEYHAIAVKIDRPKLKVPTQAGYYPTANVSGGALAVQQVTATTVHSAILAAVRIESAQKLTRFKRLASVNPLRFRLGIGACRILSDSNAVSCSFEADIKVSNGHIPSQIAHQGRKESILDEWAPLAKLRSNVQWRSPGGLLNAPPLLEINLCEHLARKRRRNSYQAAPKMNPLMIN